MEYLGTVNHRRRWSRDEKARIIAESDRPGNTVSGVAKRYGIAPRLLFEWRKKNGVEYKNQGSVAAKLRDELERKNARIKQLEEQLAKAKERQAAFA